MLTPAMTQTISLVTREVVGTDELGNDVYGDVEVTVTGCSLQPVGSDEQLAAGNLVTSRWRLWAPIGTPLTATSRIRHDCQDYEVDGDAQTWPGPDGTPHHMVAMLRRWTG